MKDLRDRLKSRSRKGKTCFHYGNLGHTKRECGILKKEQEENNVKESDKDTTKVAFNGEISFCE